ncbi:MAG: hypothetical protein Q7Q71_05805 [Verrucomicrobiota bacterium JB023]|nr:hypothetical protein [Verrucomicrobiota bacterium JB023]
MMRLACLTGVAAALLLGACDRHSWDKAVDIDGDGKISATERPTKELYVHHGEHAGHGDHAEHGDHGDHGDHSAHGDAHGEHDAEKSSSHDHGHAADEH